MTGHVTHENAPNRLDGVLGDAGLRAAVAYWDSLRGARVLPSRMDLDPAALRPHLQDTAIVEVARPGSLRIRLGGGRINALLGMDVRGLPLRSLFDLSDRARVSDAVETAIAEAQVLILDVMSPAPRFGGFATEALSTQIAILPMTDADLSPTRALYIMGAVEGDMGSAAAPQRWYVKDMHRLTLQPSDPVLAEPPVLRPTRAAPVSVSSTGVSEPVTETAIETRGPFARARFQVIDGGLS